MDLSKEDMREIIEGSAQLAQIVTNHYYELKKCGLEENEALQIAIGYQKAILNLGNADD